MKDKIKPFVVEVRASTDSSEAYEWAERVFRMMQRWAESHEWPIRVVDALPGEECGFKYITSIVDGELAYQSFLKERGFHRLHSSSKSVTDTSVDIFPMVENFDIVSPSDLTHGTRPNGDSFALTHTPTGISIRVVDGYSRERNSHTAFGIICSKLTSIKLSGHRVYDGNWRLGPWNPIIRKYSPDSIFDCVTGIETHDTKTIMDGGLDVFHMLLRALSKAEARKEILKSHHEIQNTLKNFGFWSEWTRERNIRRKMDDDGPNFTPLFPDV